jgi:hypothetical protein
LGNGANGSGPSALWGGGLLKKGGRGLGDYPVIPVTHVTQPGVLFFKEEHRLVFVWPAALWIALSGCRLGRHWFFLRARLFFLVGFMRLL